MSSAKYLAWVDLEMTGLNFQTDYIVEIAVIVTDMNLNIVATGPNLIIHQSPEVLANMGPVVAEMHTTSGLINDIRNSKVSTSAAEQEVLEFLKQYSEPGIMPLCGNSVWQDRLFMIHHMPLLADFFHYRNIDVSTIKELVKSWYSAPDFPKSKHHRALDDIEESIDELKHFREKYFIKS